MGCLLVGGRAGLAVVAGQLDRIAWLGARRRQVVLNTRPNALEVLAQAGMVEVVAGALLRSGMGGVLGEAVDQIELAREGRQLRMLWGGIAR